MDHARELDPFVMLEDEILTHDGNEELWWKMALAEKTVNLFDKSTWESEDYELLVDIVHELIAIRAIQQQ